MTGKCKIISSLAQIYVPSLRIEKKITFLGKITGSLGQDEWLTFHVPSRMKMMASGLPVGVGVGAMGWEQASKLQFPGTMHGCSNSPR